MKLYGLLICVMSLVSIGCIVKASDLEIVDAHKEDGRCVKAVTNYTVSEILIGTGIGALTGIAAAEIDHKYPDIWPLTWVCSYFVRKALVHDISSMLQTPGAAMNICSCLASWLAYYSDYKRVI